MEEKPPSESEQKPGLEGLYERMNRYVRDNLEKAGSLTEESLERALQEAREWGRHLKDQYGDDVPRVTEYLRRDFQDAIRHAREQARRSLDLDRLGVGVLGFVQRMAQRAGSRLDSFASRLDEKLSYKTGEVTGPGRLTCVQCDQQLSFEQATRIPPCPKCRGTSYRRGY